jgi:hypothetical protein
MGEIGTGVYSERQKKKKNENFTHMSKTNENFTHMSKKNVGERII